MALLKLKRPDNFRTLSLLMVTFNSILSWLLNGLLIPFRGINPLWPLLVISVLAGALLLLVFRYSSNQQGIQETKDRIKAHLLEIRLFKDDLGILLSAQGLILKYNLRYMTYGLKPLLLIILPVAVVLIQLEGWFGCRPLKPGEATLVSVFFSRFGPGDLPSVELEVDDGIAVESPSLRIPATGEVDWALKTKKPGEHRLLIKFNGTEISKSVTVSAGELVRVSPVRPSSNLWHELLYPGEPPIPKHSLVTRINVDYPSRSIEVLGWKLHWLLVFFVISTLSGFSLKGIFKVQI